MPQRQIGIRGYVGEAVVKEWLDKKYSNLEEYKIVSQIMPNGVPKKGGGYLDFAVVKENIVTSIYEVKTQDYILDKTFHINKALLFMWENKGKNLELITQNREKYYSNSDTQSYLIILVPPNYDGINNVGMNNLKNIILFKEIFKELEHSFNKTKIRNELLNDFENEIENLKNPTQGKTLLDDFIKKRSAT